MLPSLSRLSLRHDAAIGAPASDGMLSDAALEDASRPILKGRPPKYANDVARQIWGANWFENDKQRRLAIAERVLKRLFPERLPNDGVVRAIDGGKIKEFVSAIKAELGLLPLPPPNAVAPPPPKKKPKQRLAIPKDDTTDDEEDAPPPIPPPADPPPPVTALSQDLLAKVLSQVVLSEDPCSRLEELCRVNQEFADVCKNGQLYALVNAGLKWDGEGLPKQIFKQNCRNLRYAMPIATRRMVRVGSRTFGANLPEYVFANDFQKRLFLRYFAASKFLQHAEDNFNDVAGQGYYGDVTDGDWEAAGIKIEMSNEYRLGLAVQEPLEKLVNQILDHWRSQNFDATNVVLSIRQGQPYDDGDEIEEKYGEIINEYRTEEMTNNDKTNKTEFNLVLDRFVTEMLKEENEEEE